jgi:hypothetical protein
MMLAIKIYKVRDKERTVWNTFRRRGSCRGAIIESETWHYMKRTEGSIKTMEMTEMVAAW